MIAGLTLIEVNHKQEKEDNDIMLSKLIHQRRFGEVTPLLKLFDYLLKKP